MLRGSAQAIEALSIETESFGRRGLPGRRMGCLAEQLTIALDAPNGVQPAHIAPGSYDS